MESILDAINEWIKAVSYTHLDVYKRQRKGGINPTLSK